MVLLWYMDNNLEDLQKPHQTDPFEYVPVETVEKLGVCVGKADTDKLDECTVWAKARTTFNFPYEDRVVYDQCNMAGNYNEKLVMKVQDEHTHEDDHGHILFDGSGYFDIREPDSQRWIRIEAGKGDMVIVPKGLYHRFVLDKKVRRERLDHTRERLDHTRLEIS